MKSFIFAFVFSWIGVISFVTSSISSSVPSTSTVSGDISTSTEMSSTVSFKPSSSILVNLAKKSFFVNIERPKMINQINLQRNGMSQNFLCQDSLLTSIAQQHANDMAALDTLAHNLPCDSTAFPTQFCLSSSRLAPYGTSAENIIALTGNDGSASAAMGKFNADATSFHNMMSSDYLYIGIGMAMNPISGNYYWAQVFSAGNFQGVSCTLTPSVTVLDAFNRTTTTVQPKKGLKCGLYPKGIQAGGNVNGVEKLYCTMIPFAQGPSASALPLGQLPYPTITMLPLNSTSILGARASSLISVFQSALAQANATIVGPSSISLFPMMQVVPTPTIDSSSLTDDDDSIPTSSVNLSANTFGNVSMTMNPASMLSSFTPTNSAQSSAFVAISSMMANPSMSSAMLQMAQFLLMAPTPQASNSSSSN